MSEITINIPSGESKRLLTGGKLCREDIVVTAESPVSPNLFDINALKLAAGVNWGIYAPKVENGVFYSAGRAGYMGGACSYVYVTEGDVIKFSANVTGQIGYIEVRAFPYPTDGIIAAGTNILLEAFQNHNASFEKFYSIPTGCTCFGFCAYSSDQYGMAFTDISMTQEVSGAAEQAVAYSILMGDAI